MGHRATRQLTPRSVNSGKRRWTATASPVISKFTEQQTALNPFHFLLPNPNSGRRLSKMSDAGSDTATNPPPAEVEVAETTTETKSGPMSVEDALQEVIKTALVHDGLARGLRECAKALDKRQAHLCVLVETVTEGRFHHR